MQFVTQTTLAAAGRQLAQALRNHVEGFVCRVDIPREQCTYAKQLAHARRVAAKHATGKPYRDAMSMPEGAEEQARLVADARALLAELVVADALKAARVQFTLQPLVSYTSEHGADLLVDGKHYDIKSAGQASPSWHHGVVKSCRLTDDRMFTIRGSDARHYATQDAAGYVCVYVYVLDDVPFAADLYYVAAATVNGKAERSATLANKSASWHGVDVAFPDGLVNAGRSARLLTLDRAGYHSDLPTMNREATAVRASCAAEMLAALRWLAPALSGAECLFLGSYINRKLHNLPAGYWSKARPADFGAQHLFEMLMERSPHDLQLESA